MNRRQKLIISITGITIVMLALLGLTYGYYLTRIQGNTNSNSISITTADLTLTYRDGTGELIANNIMPGDEITSKTFTVKNEGQDVESYTVALINIMNNFTFKDDLEVSVSCSSNINSGVCEGFAEDYEDNIYKEKYPAVNSELFSLGIKENETHTFTLTVDYLYQDFDQSDDMGKTLKGKVQIYDPKDTIEVTGTVTGASEGDYAEIHSDVQTSEIIDGVYKFVGIPADNHTIYIKNRNTNAEKSTTLEIKKGTEESTTNNVITFTDTSKRANVTIDATSANLNTTVNDVNEGSKTYQLYIATRSGYSSASVEDCYNGDDGYTCSGPYEITINDNMTLNNFLNSENSSVLKNSSVIVTGQKLKSLTDFTTGSCADKASILEDKMLYFVIMSAGYVYTTIRLTEYDDDSLYMDQRKNEVYYPNDEILLNDNFQNDNNIIVAVMGEYICFVDD